MKEFFGGKRLGQVVHGPGLDGLHGQLGRGIRGDHKCGQIRPLAVHPRQKFIARHTAQAGICDHHQEFFLRQQVQRLLGGFGRAGGVAFIAQHRLERTAHVFFVVHDQDGGQRHVHVTNGLGTVFAGKVTMNFAPFPSSDSSRTVPP